jgi:hypothetical protein
MDDRPDPLGLASVPLDATHSELRVYVAVPKPQHAPHTARQLAGLVRSEVIGVLRKGDQVQTADALHAMVSFTASADFQELTFHEPDADVRRLFGWEGGRWLR